MDFLGMEVLDDGGWRKVFCFHLSFFLFPWTQDGLFFPPPGIGSQNFLTPCFRKRACSDGGVTPRKKGPPPLSASLEVGISGSSSFRPTQQFGRTLVPSP